MGMAASQARFLGLTARKTNVEYEGQQINQQRTTLSNTTANYYNQLLGMAVPVPPSVADYTKTVYTFQDGSLMNSITSMIARNNGEYLISYNSSWTDDFTPVSQMSHIVATMGDDAEGNKLYEDFVYGTAGGCYTYLNDTSHDKNQKTQINHLIHVVNHMLGKGSYTTTNGNSFNITQNDIYWTTPNPPYGGDAATMASIAERIKDKPAAQKLVDLLYNAKEAYKGTVSQATLDNLRNQLNAIVENDLQDALSANYMVGADTLRKLGQISEITYNADGSINKYIGNDEYLKTLSNTQLQQLIDEEKEYIALLTEKYGKANYMVRYIKNTTTGEYEPQFYKREDLIKAIYSETDTSLSSIVCYKMGSAKKNEEVKGITARFEQDASGRLINVTLKPGEEDQVTYAVTTETVTDQAKYDDAMNQYEYDKYQYDQSIQEINAKIEIIQSEDKNLELRLKQLDTEQDAISTEMDAVQKVIEKNTESSFKTFG